MISHFSGKDGGDNPCECDFCIGILLLMSIFLLQEMEALHRGVKEFGAGNWKEILLRVGGFSQGRT